MGDEIEAVERENEVAGEAVDGGALIGVEHVPPLHGGIAQEQRHVQRRHGLHHLVNISPFNHLSFRRSHVISQN